MGKDSPHFSTQSPKPLPPLFLPPSLITTCLSIISEKEAEQRGKYHGMTFGDCSRSINTTTNDEGNDPTGSPGRGGVVLEAS